MQIVAAKFSSVFTNVISGWYQIIRFTQTQWKLHINHNVCIRTRAESILEKALRNCHSGKKVVLTLLLLWDPNTVPSHLCLCSCLKNHFMYLKRKQNKKEQIWKKISWEKWYRRAALQGRKLRGFYLTALLHCKTPTKHVFPGLPS